MKKSIVAAVVFLAVTGSLLVAQEPKLKLQARTKMNLVTVYHDLETSENSKNAVELRASYKMDAISLVSHNNVTLGDDEMILYNMVNLAYSVSDLLRPCIMVANTNSSGDAAAIAGNVITVRPGLTLSPRKGATIDAGVRFEYFSPEDGDSMTRISVPVVFRVKL